VTFSAPFFSCRRCRRYSCQSLHMFPPHDRLYGRVDFQHGVISACPVSSTFSDTSLPKAVEKARLFGPRLTALVAFLKGVCHASFSMIRKFLRHVESVKVSCGDLAKLTAKVYQAMAGAYSELFHPLAYNTNTKNPSTTKKL
jgi:hypothetical protein